MENIKKDKFYIDYEFDPRYRPAFIAGRIVGYEIGIQHMKEIISESFNNLKKIVDKSLTINTLEEKNNTIKQIQEIIKNF